MAKHKYISNTCVLFDDEEIIDDKTNNKSITNNQAENNQILKQQEDILRRTLEISNRILGSAQETEDLGIETARELKHQGDQLKNTNANLDKMQADLKVSEHNINGMKSFFKRVKCYFRGKGTKVTNKCKLPSDVIEKPSPIEPIISDSYQVACDHVAQEQKTLNLTGTNKDLNDMVEENTTQIYITAVKLKEIAQAMGKEIDEQDTVLDGIQQKVDKADIKIGHQTIQINKLLKK